MNIIIAASQNKIYIQELKRSCFELIFGRTTCLWVCLPNRLHVISVKLHPRPWWNRELSEEWSIIFGTKTTTEGERLMLNCNNLSRGNVDNAKDVSCIKCKSILQWPTDNYVVNSRPIVVVWVKGTKRTFYGVWGQHRSPHTP